MAWFVTLLIAIAVNVAAYLLAPKPKTAKPEAAKDLEGPTSTSDRPIPVIWGTMRVSGVNYLYWGDKSKQEYERNA